MDMEADQEGGMTERDFGTARKLLSTGDKVATAEKLVAQPQIDHHIDVVEDEEDIASSCSNLSIMEAGKTLKDDPETMIQKAID